ncbi:protein adenylyltransferase SelO [Pasteurellaceae bacterium 22721_9_1]
MSSSLNWNLSHTYRSLPQKFYSEGQSADFPAPEIVVFNTALAQELGLLTELHNYIDANIFVGNQFPDNSLPISQAYAGHQFGYFNMLGDGRATLIGEQCTPQGDLVDIQLKGNGKTPYSRRGDGKAALAPMLREYLISEAMHALGIPSTRSLAVTTTGEHVQRENMPKGAVLTRTAMSHIRVATFQFAAQFGDLSDVKALADYSIQRHFPALLSQDNPYQLFLRAVIQKQAQLIAKWQLVGFVHGVMNTDNISIAGETIDYGPCAFMDIYHPKTVFSSIDYEGLYRYENQPFIAKWALARLAEVLLPLLHSDISLADEVAKQELQQFMPLFESYYNEGMAKKLGIMTYQSSDKALLEQLLELMQKYKADYSNTFVRLTLDRREENGDYLEATETLFSAAEFQQWKQSWSERINSQHIDKQKIVRVMQANNPFAIPRNALVEEALQQAEQENLQKFTALLHVLQQPFYYHQAVTDYQKVIVQPGYRTFCGT